MNCRACMTSGEWVSTSMPSVSGVAQDSIRPPRLPRISTVQMRHDPQARSSGWKQRLGISMPAMRAASRMTVPAGTVTSCPLMVPVTIFCSVRVAVTIVEAFALQSAVSLDATHGEMRCKSLATSAILPCRTHANREFPPGLAQREEW